MKSLQMNVVNAAIFVFFVVASGWFAAQGQWVGALVFLAALGAALAWAWWARRGAGSDLSRLDTGYAVDEREVRLAEQALSWVGVTAFVGQMALFGVEFASRQPPGWNSDCIRLLVLCLAWMTANRVLVLRARR
ncbi:MAG: hypothetical protein QG671_1049 [Actinomycetota bacterium]|nr:hypothetical protein [Actinomycetota bacterium]